MTGPTKPKPPNPAPPHAAAQRPDSPPPAPAAPPAFILASASPRRQSLLRDAGYCFITHPSGIDESDHPPNLSPEQFARHLAERKARAVAADFPESVILAADTVVAARPPSAHAPAAEPLGSRAQPRDIILGKPADLADARRILTLLSGTTHSVITAIAILRLHPPFSEITAVHSTVHMRRLTDAEVMAYLATNQWQGKAGAYG
ncbi:MAG TPA: Maf family protein, partial [Tepidisphaeraceae bacterium]|nr:Maf family protein [Tepidisphaeraceae bacterium]